MEILIIFGVFAAGFTAFRIYQRRSIKKEAAEYFSRLSDYYPHLNYRQESLFHYPKLFGSIDNIPVRGELRIVSGHGDTFYLALQTRHASREAGSLSISKETRFSKMRQSAGFYDIQCGDSRFDDEMLLKASRPWYMMAILNHRVRLSILQLGSAVDFHITELYVESKRRWDLVRDSKDIKTFLDDMFVVSRTISSDTSAREMLIENALTDPIADVRIKNLQALASYFGIDDAIIELLSPLLEYRNPEVQVEAARLLGNQGMEHLTGMLKSNDTIPNELLVAIVEILKENKYWKSIDVLREVYSLRSNSTLRIEILSAFKECGHQSLSSFLVGFLQSESDLTVPIIEVLGTCGTREAVEPLYRVSKDSINPIIRNAVSKAIAQIQSRLEDVGKGWLSLEMMSDTEGALSVSREASEGSLSVADIEETNENHDINNYTSLKE